LRTAKYGKLQESAVKIGHKIGREKARGGTGLDEGRTGRERQRKSQEGVTGILQEHGGLNTPFLTSTSGTIQYIICIVNRNIRRDGFLEQQQETQDPPLREANPQEWGTLRVFVSCDGERSSIPDDLDHRTGPPVQSRLPHPS